MRVDKVYPENRINYTRENALPASSEKRKSVGNATVVLEEKNSLPALYKRDDINNARDYIVNLSPADILFSDEEQPVLQGVFHMDTDQENEMEHRFSSWTRTVNSILAREFKKGTCINRVV